MYTQEQIDRFNELMKEVDSISHSSNSLEVEGDPFTLWDTESVWTKKYIDGRVEESRRRDDILPSVRLHKINSVMESWGLKLSNYPQKRDINCRFSWSGGLYITIQMNSFHTTLFQIDDNYSDAVKNSGSKKVGVWIEYNDNFPEIIDKHIIEMATKSGSVSLLRELKIRNLVGL